MEPFTLELIASLPGHHDRVWSVSWSPQGDMLASCSADKTVRIWQRRRGSSTAASGETAGPAGPAGPSGGPAAHQQWYCCAILDQCHTRTIRSVAWSPSGRALATASFDATVAVWELSGGIWEQVAELEGHENEVKCVAWNPDGRLIATCGRDRSVWIWESMPGREFECVDVKQGHSQDVKVVRWHPGGELLVSAGYDDTIKLWTYDGDEWVCAQTMGGTGHGAGHTSTVWDVCWEPAGQRLASCSDDLTLRIWESRAATSAGNAASATPDAEAASGAGGGAAATGGFVPSRPDLRCATTLSGHHSRTVFSLDWGPTGLIATGDGDDSICVFGQGDPELARLLLQRAESGLGLQAAAAAGPEADAQVGPAVAAGHSGASAQARAAPAGPDSGAAAGGSGLPAPADLGLGAPAGASAGSGRDVSMSEGAEVHVGGNAGASDKAEGSGPGQQGGPLVLSQPGGPWGRWAVVRGAHSADVNCVRWNPAEPRLLASCSDDGLIRMWWLR